MTDIWQFLTSLSAEEYFWMLLWALLSFLPFIAFALGVKKKIKVGKIDIHVITTWLLIFLACLFALLNARIGTNETIRTLLSLSGIFIGFLLMIVIFNRTSEGIRKAFLVEIQIEKFNLNINYCYIYEYSGHQAVIDLNNEGHESFWKMLKRLFGKRVFLECKGAQFEFREHFVNLCYLCLVWKHTRKTLEINSKEVECEVIVVTPIPTTRFSQLEFLVNFTSFSELQDRLMESETKRMEMEADMFSMALDLQKSWAEIFDKAQFGDNRLSIRAILAKYQKAKEAEVKDQTKKGQKPAKEEEEEEEEEGEEPADIEEEAELEDTEEGDIPE